MVLDLQSIGRWRRATVSQRGVDRRGVDADPLISIIGLGDGWRLPLPRFMFRRCISIAVSSVDCRRGDWFNRFGELPHLIGGLCVVEVRSQRRLSDGLAHGGRLWPGRRSPWLVTALTVAGLVSRRLISASVSGRNVIRLVR